MVLLPNLVRAAYQKIISRTIPERFLELLQKLKHRSVSILATEDKLDIQK
jgi:Anti-sigma factor NepR